MLILYDGDTAVCAAKVRVTLAEKRIDWQSKRIDLARGEQFDPEYLKLNPNGVIPTLIHDGNVLTESTVINEYLDETFPENPLRPEGAYQRAKLRLWTKREDSIHYAINTMSTAIIFRPTLLAMTPAQQSARIDSIPDPSRRAKFHELMQTGLQSKSVTDALVTFARLFRDMEKALADGPWLMGQQFTLADGGLMSFFNRLEMLQIGGMWKENFPRVTEWNTQARARPSFNEAIGRHIPQATLDKYRTEGTKALPIVRQQFAGILKEI
jgi:glutathione S-transferase